MHQIRHTIALTIPASDDLHRAVRAAMIAKGTTLNGWCIANGFTRQTVDKALKGERQSRLSRAIVGRLLVEAFGDRDAA